MKKIAKSLTAVLCAVLTLGFTACQKDAEDLIIGSWEVVSSTLIMDDGTNVDTRTETLGEGMQMVFTFNKDLSCEISGTWTNDGRAESDALQGTYSISGDLLTMVLTVSWQDDEGEWHSDVETMTFTIKTLEKDDLVLSRSQSRETEEGTITSTKEYNFKRA